jgi:membrane protein EpsK
MLLNRVDLIVINAYFAAVITGGYGTMTQFPVLMETLVATASTVIRPIMLLKYAQGDLLSLRDFSFRSVKLFGTALALPVGLICGFSQPLISIWLGPDYAYFNTLLIILVCHMSLSLAVKPLMYIQNTYNMVRWPGIVTLLCGVASVIADLLIVKLGWGYLAIAGSTAIIWSLRNVIFTPIYSAHNMKLPWWSFLPSLIFTLIGTLFVWGTSYILTIFYMPNSFFTLAGAATIISLLYAVFAWVFGINAAEKEMLIDLARVNINLILRRSKI